jgi:hypothetical protein
LQKWTYWWTEKKVKGTDDKQVYMSSLSYMLCKTALPSFYTLMGASATEGVELLQKYEGIRRRGGKIGTSLYIHLKILPHYTSKSVNRYSTKQADQRRSEMDRILDLRALKTATKSDFVLNELQAKIYPSASSFKNVTKNFRKMQN